MYYADIEPVLDNGSLPAWMGDEIKETEEMGANNIRHGLYTRLQALLQGTPTIFSLFLVAELHCICVLRAQRRRQRMRAPLPHELGRKTSASSHWLWKTVCDFCTTVVLMVRGLAINRPHPLVTRLIHNVKQGRREPKVPQH